MIQPSPTARASKRTTPKPDANPRRTAKASTGKALPAHENESQITRVEATRIGRFVRYAAGKIAADIEESYANLGSLLLATDGEDQLGLYELRVATLDLHIAIERVSAAIGNTKVRGEDGHTDESDEFQQTAHNPTSSNAH